MQMDTDTKSLKAEYNFYSRVFA